MLEPKVADAVKAPVIDGVPVKVPWVTEIPLRAGGVAARTTPSAKETLLPPPPPPPWADTRIGKVEESSPIAGNGFPTIIAKQS